MNIENQENIYLKVDSMNLTPFEKYKYLTENDQDIVKLRQKVRTIVTQKSLLSVMSDTKWLKLQQGIETLPFPPAYNEKLILGDEPKFAFNELKQEPAYFGDWSSFWEEGLPIFFMIERLEIRPKYGKYQGQLLPHKVTDETAELIELLNNLKIPFELDKGSVIIYGYK